MVTRERVRPGGLDAIEIAFDDERLVADAGLVLPATLGERLGAEGVIDGLVDRPSDRAIGAGAGAKALSVVFAMLAGADSIEGTDRLRAGATGTVLGLCPRAGSTSGKWLRGLGFGQVRQLDAAAGELLRRAWEAGARPKRLVIDLDSSIAQVHGHKKRGARYGHTRVLGYHPILATSAETGEVIHARLRNGAANTQYGAVRFFCETIARCRRAGHRGPFLVRADAGFLSYDLFRVIRRHGGHFSVAATMQAHVRAAIEQIEAAEWAPIAYPGSGRAEIAETTVAVDARHRTGAHPLPERLRLVVRRVLNHDPAHPQQPLFSDYRYFPILTSRTDDRALVEAEHRDHAQIELVIRDLKDAGLAHVPSGATYANMAWLVLATLAHNMQRWVAILGLGERRITQHRTIRNRYLAIPGRLVTHARRWRLRLPASWPWRGRFLAAIARLRALPALT
jgi:Transposase DDE domain group 1